MSEVAGAQPGLRHGVNVSTLILIRGLPGSGKTWFANHLPGYYDLNEYQMIAADDYFNHPDGYKFEAAALPQAHKWCQAQTLKYIRHGWLTVVHNTFTQKWELDPYIRMTLDHNDRELEVYSLFDAGFTDEELAERNTHGVPETAIANMRARWESYDGERMVDRNGRVAT